MFVVWFFWLFVLSGGLYMGLMAVAASLQTGFSLVNVLNVVVYLGCGLYAIPRVWRLLTTRPAGSSH